MLRQDWKILPSYGFLHVYNVSSYSSAPESKNAVCAFIKQSEYFHVTYDSTSIHSHATKLYVHMFDIVDTALVNRILISAGFLQGERK